MTDITVAEQVSVKKPRVKSVYALTMNHLDETLSQKTDAKVCSRITVKPEAILDWCQQGYSCSINFPINDRIGT